MTGQVHCHVSALCDEEGCEEKEVTLMVYIYTHFAVQSWLNQMPTTHACRCITAKKQ